MPAEHGACSDHAELGGLGLDRSQLDGLLFEAERQELVLGCRNFLVWRRSSGATECVPLPCEARRHVFQGASVSEPVWLIDTDPVQEKQQREDKLLKLRKTYFDWSP